MKTETVSVCLSRCDSLFVVSGNFEYKEDVVGPHLLSTSRFLQLVLSSYIHHTPTQAELCSLLDAQKTTFLEVKLEYVSLAGISGCVWAALSKLLGHLMYPPLRLPDDLTSGQNEWATG